MNMNEDYLNKILLCAVSNRWDKQSYLQGWSYESNTYKDTYYMKKKEVTKKV